MPGAETVVTAVGWVVVVSVLLHGVSTTPVAAWYGRRAAAVTLPEAREGEGSDVLRDRGTDAPRLDVLELAAALDGPAPPTVVDVRTPGARAADPRAIPGSLVVEPADVGTFLDALPGPTRVAFWCTCPAEATAARAARRAIAAGHDAAAVSGGLGAWLAAGPRSPSAPAPEPTRAGSPVAGPPERWSPWRRHGPGVDVDAGPVIVRVRLRSRSERSTYWRMPPWR